MPLQMEITLYYLIFFLSLLILVGLCRSLSILLRLGSRRLVYILTRFLQYPLLIQRRYWTVITRFNALFIFLYLASNCIALGISIKDAREFEQRAALVAVINLTVLFLGGRTNPCADLLGISLQSYYLVHHWIGRIALAEGLLHAIVVIALRPRPGGVYASGFIVSGPCYNCHRIFLTL